MNELKSPILYTVAAVAAAASGWTPHFEDRPVSAEQSANIAEALPDAPIVLPQSPGEY